MELVSVKVEQDYGMSPSHDSWYVTLHIQVTTEHRTDALVAIADIVGEAIENAR